LPRENEQVIKPILLMLLATLASSAAAVSYKCTDANGQVTYTNTACPNGVPARIVDGESVSVIDNSGARALAAEEQAKSEATDDLVPEGKVMSDKMAAENLAKLREAQALAQSAMAVRGWVGAGAAAFLLIATIFMFIMRWRKRRAEAAALAARMELLKSTGSPQA
jgi:hypothetical protein